MNTGAAMGLDRQDARKQIACRGNDNGSPPAGLPTLMPPLASPRLGFSSFHPMNINSDQLHRLGCRRSSPLHSYLLAYEPSLGSSISNCLSFLLLLFLVCLRFFTTFPGSPRGHLLRATALHQNHTSLLTLMSSS